MRPRGRVVFTERFAAFERKVKEGVAEGMEVVMAEAKDEARAGARDRYRSGRMDQGFYSGVELTEPSRIRGYLGNRQFYARFQSSGTSSGISPAHFFERGLRAAIRAAPAAVRGAIRVRRL